MKPRKKPQTLKEAQKRAKSRVAKKRLRTLFLSLLLPFAVLFALSYLLRTEPIPGPSAGASVTMIDVGQGDSVLIQVPSANILIDGGEAEAGDAVEDALRRHGVKKIDYLINSHPHSDHVGGLTQVVEDFEVGQVFLPAFPESLTPTAQSYLNFLTALKKKGLSVQTPENARKIELAEGAALTFYSIDNSEFDDLNNCSLCVRLTVGKRAFLFCGDMESKAEKRFLEEGKVLPADVLKVAHHGSSTSSTEEFLAAVRPKYALISAGADNSYGHPNPKALGRLKDAGAQICRTDTDGEITVEVSESGELTVQTAKEP